ncbi:MAG: hypothetical protein M3N21_05670 [Actinomycetota bacterium]|nr:hypothetical protein [Actinomycetota bacterium]
MHCPWCCGWTTVELAAERQALRERQRRAGGRLSRPDLHGLLLWGVG